MRTIGRSFHYPSILFETAYPVEGHGALKHITADSGQKADDTQDWSSINYRACCHYRPGLFIFLGQRSHREDPDSVCRNTGGAKLDGCTFQGEGQREGSLHPFIHPGISLRSCESWSCGSRPSRECSLSLDASLTFIGPQGNPSPS